MSNEIRGHTPSEVFDLATHPRQYDIAPTGWDGRGEPNEAAARIKNYLSYLTPLTEKWNGRNILDIGAGTGWLVDHANQKGAANAVGIEPAGTNVVIGRVVHPTAKLLQVSFENYKPEPQEEFDTVVSIMAFGHIADLPRAFQKIKKLLKPSPESEVILVVPEYDYFTKPRNGYKEVVVFDMSPDVALEMTVKEDGSSLADIIRQPGIFHHEAKAVGLHGTHDIPMPPTEEYMKAVPRYQNNRDVAMTRLLRYTL